MAGLFPTCSLMPIQPAVIRHLGQAEYEPTFAAMRAFTDARQEDTPDELWIVEHPPVYTLGLGADRGHLLAGATSIPTVQTDRGGEVTFHGPGQVVIYLMMDLRRNKKGGKLYARQFVNKIEEAIIHVLAAYNLAGERIEGAPGIYIANGPKKGAKIAALGLKVRGNGCTYHGVSLNVGMDLALHLDQSLRLRRPGNHRHALDGRGCAAGRCPAGPGQ